MQHLALDYTGRRLSLYTETHTDTHGHTQILRDIHRYSRTHTNTHGHTPILTVKLKFNYLTKLAKSLINYFRPERLYSQ